MRGILTDAERMILAAKRAGYPISFLEETDDNGQTRTRVELDTRSNAGAIDVLRELATLYAQDAEILALGATLAVTGERKYRARLPPGALWTEDEAKEARGRQIHTYVKANVRYLEEEEETFRSPMMTIRYGLGDCDEHALCVACLGTAAGLRVRLEAMGKGGVISHVVAQIHHHGRWHYAETTLDAEYGEEPFRAARRLSAVRPDLV